MYTLAHFSNEYTDSYLDCKEANRSLYEEAVNPSRFDVVKWQIDNVARNKTTGGNYYYSDAFRSPLVPAPPLPCAGLSQVVLNDRFSSNSTDELLLNDSNCRGSVVECSAEIENIYATYNESVNNTYI